MNYKIIEETEYSGKKWYYIKKRYCWYFWKYLANPFKFSFNSLEEAQKQIQLDVDEDYRKSQSKIKSRKIINL